VDQGDRIIELAASILSANFACLGAEAQPVVEVVVLPVVAKSHVALSRRSLY